MKHNHKDLSLVAGVNLKQLIKESKYKTQENFADAFYVEVRTVRRWISKGISKVDTIQQIANFFEVPFSAILE